MGAILRKYGTGAGADLYIPIVKAGSIDFAASGDWTPAGGDVKVSKDGGAQANIGTLPTYTNGAWKFVFTNAELACAFLTVMVVDAATKAVEDQAILIETYGHVSAQHAFDLDKATQDVNVTQISGDGTAADNLEADYDDTGYVKGNSALGTVAQVNAIKLSGREDIADTILDRPISNVEPGAALRTLYGAICALVNRVRIVNNKDLEIYKTDDATVLGTMTGTLDASQKPIKELDP
jgi:hypothetical protein